jgi:hypothetical protein
MLAGLVELPRRGMKEGTYMDGAACSMVWACREKTLEVTCRHGAFLDRSTVEVDRAFDRSGSYRCRCLEGEAEVGSFALDNACPDLSYREQLVARRIEMSRRANASCSWKLPLTY